MPTSQTPTRRAMLPRPRRPHLAGGLARRAAAIARDAQKILGGPRMVLTVPALLLLLTLTPGCIFGGRHDPKPAGPFARYPSSPALSAVVQTHRDAANDPREDRVLLTTWFLDGDPRVAMMCSVRPDGHVSTYRYVHDYAVQNSRSADLVPDQVSQLSAALSRLPPSQQPALADLLIVSFRRNGAWVTRTYDRTAPPAPVAELFAVTGAPLQAGPGKGG